MEWWDWKDILQFYRQGYLACKALSLNLDQIKYNLIEIKSWKLNGIFSKSWDQCYKAITDVKVRLLWRGAGALV